MDDEADARTTLGAILDQFGAESTMVGSAADAFDEISRDCPHVLLSDLAMPGVDGYTLIRRIRASVDANGLPAAAVSAYVDRDSQTHALDAGFQAYLLKAVDSALLATTLATLIHRPE